ncbi:Hypothetical predicted protein [Paramuricea clavata]|uniref:Uncharacterized protein n=1 Tax=Paramuricea clavata TaxID=317549 RepID=A0A6S7FVD9_PARCT|nr:Hypothetical predicted protein [Paramuricea clavata]
MLLRNAVAASKNANCETFLNCSTTIIPFFHFRKHKVPLVESSSESNSSDQPDSTPEEDLLCSNLNAPTTSEFLSNTLFYIGGFIVSKLVKKLSCSSCKTRLLAQFTTTTHDHNYCALNFNEVASALAFTLFANNGNLQILSDSVYAIVEYAEKDSKQTPAIMTTKLQDKRDLKRNLS